MAGATNSATLPPDYHRKQWKYVGYRGFSAFLASDNDLLVLRRFSKLATRSLLALQDELVELEDQLETLEDQLMQSAGPNMHHGSFRQETQDVRVALVEEIQSKLRVYYDLVNQYTQIRSRPKAAPRNIISIQTWHTNHPNAILSDETSYLTHPTDLFPLISRKISTLRGFLERSTSFRLLKLWEKRTADEDTVHYMSDRRIDFFVNAIITVLGLVMLTAPLWILAYRKKMVERLGIITGFVFVFLCLVCFLSVARPFEVLAATAA
ncbi:hypothetical protein K458DRAFT_398458 [Lentithecium fluviatile CBS 122367]|uniref:DUF6594 domain-containing protein n=1 Tax=Lentithecium fluviatile CBS 122367 TaxID=1168545 RepID=A0A6G1JPF6_9PLEO|nr:hypothetical protein K458DRAFT_398458 [Lentithecium fluviatile CBS 122367]